MKKGSLAGFLKMTPRATLPSPLPRLIIFESNNSGKASTRAQGRRQPQGQQGQDGAAAGAAGALPHGGRACSQGRHRATETGIIRRESRALSMLYI